MSAISAKRKGDRLVPLKEATKITGRCANYLRRLTKERRLAYVQERAHAKLFFWESDLLSYFAQQERRAVR